MVQTRVHDFLKKSQSHSVSRELHLSLSKLHCEKALVWSLSEACLKFEPVVVRAYIGVHNWPDMAEGFLQVSSICACRKIAHEDFVSHNDVARAAFLGRDNTSFA